MLRIFTACALALASGACATVTRGTTNQVIFASNPPGAKAQTSMGYMCPATPCTYSINRKAEFVTTFTKDGYEPMQVLVQTRIAGSGVAGFAGNIVAGGIIGMGVDAGTGATLEHFPNPVFADLVPIAPRITPRGEKRKKFRVRRPEPARQEDAAEAPGS